MYQLHHGHLADTDMRVNNLHSVHKEHILHLADGSHAC